jgi:hypothetical protein
MKLDNQSNKVVLVHFFWLIAGALLGVVVGKPDHIMLGISLGSLLGTLVPGVYAEFVLRSKGETPKNRQDAGAPSITLTHLCAAVFDNNRVTKDMNRSAIEEIRGMVYVTWFGVMVGTLVAGFALNAALVGISLGALLGGLLFRIAYGCFNL